jgi:zinc transport system ATP-binding protein
MTQDPAARSNAVIQIDGVSFAYDGVPVLNDVSLSIEKGDFVCIVGPNGGGKTTLLRLILGLLRPRSGRIRVFGLPPDRARHRIGYVPQYSQHDLQFPARVIDVVLTGRLDQTSWLGPYHRGDRRAALAALESVGLEGLAKRPYAALSGGQRQRVLIARALVTDPEILLLDEPTANVDVVGERVLHDILTELNERLTILMVTHDLGFVSPSVKSVACVNQKCFIHPTSEITGDLIVELYGTDVRMVHHDQLGSGETIGHDHLHHHHAGEGTSP